MARKRKVTQSKGNPVELVEDDLDKAAGGESISFNYSKISLKYTSVAKTDAAAGDGTSDIITGAGVGGGPHVR